MWLADDGRVGFGHRRLSIIDLTDAAAQPMASANGRFVIVFNGEIYNHSKLRGDLQAWGYTFRTHSDTEVILNLYDRKREDALSELRGMFAFAIWDLVDKTLFLARDPFGIKPLYYANDGYTLRFASQVKALLAGGAVDGALDPAGLVGFHLWGSVPEPVTIRRAIRSLPAGSWLRADEKGVGEPSRYHSIAELYSAAEQTNGAALSLEHARPLLLDSVRHHLVSDVPVGAFLSAGIDSGALVGLMRDAGQNRIQTVTLSFEEFLGRTDDEAPLAAEVARRFDTQHTNRVVTQAEFVADLPRILDAMDQPSVDGINTWFVSKAARELGLKVAVSGLGGDELFGGYPSFRRIPSWVKRLGIVGQLPCFGALSRRVAATIGTERFGLNPKAASMFELGGTFPGAYLLSRGLFMPWELAQVLDRDTIEEGLNRMPPLAPVESALRPCPSNPFAKVATLESSLYMRNQLLRDTDWASMAHSLEVRVPLVDATLLEGLAPHLAASVHHFGKEILAAAPSAPLPQRVVDRPKTGFSTPIATWLEQSAGPRRRDGARPFASANCPWARRWACDVIESVS
jgi:asparagine synthase (glutamine-hydrolysing)